MIYLSLINEFRHSEKSAFNISIPFHHKYSFQNLKNKNQFPLQDIKIEEEVREKSTEKSFEKGRKRRR